MTARGKGRRDGRRTVRGWVGASFRCRHVLVVLMGRMHLVLLLSSGSGDDLVWAVGDHCPRPLVLMRDEGEREGGQWMREQKPTTEADVPGWCVGSRCVGGPVGGTGGNNMGRLVMAPNLAARWPLDRLDAPGHDNYYDTRGPKLGAAPGDGNIVVAQEEAGTGDGLDKPSLVATGSVPAHL